MSARCLFPNFLPQSCEHESMRRGDSSDGHGLGWFQLRLVREGLRRECSRAQALRRRVRETIARARAASAAAAALKGAAKPGQD